MIGGGGEKKTLRLVAKYADACNLFAGPRPVGRRRSAAKLDVLRGSTASARARDYDAHPQDRALRRSRSDAGRRGSERSPSTMAAYAARGRHRGARDADARRPGRVRPRTSASTSSPGWPTSEAGPIAPDRVPPRAAS